MLRYVRIGDGGRLNFLGMEVPDADQKVLGIEYITKDGLKQKLDKELNKHFTEHIDTWSLFRLPDTMCGVNVWDILKIPKGVRGYALFTAAIHFLLFILTVTAYGLDESNNVQRLKTMTTKTMTAWISKAVYIPKAITDFGSNPRDPSKNITISDSCHVAGDRQARSSKFNTRLIILEIMEVDSRIIIFVFFFLSFMFQFFSALYQDAYYSPLIKGNAHRSHLIEYSITASLMMIAMCLQVGVVDAYTLSNVFANTWACMIFGLLSDVLCEHISVRWTVADKEGEKTNDLWDNFRESVAYFVPGKLTKCDDSDQVHHLEYKYAGEYGFRIKYTWLAHLAGWITLIFAGAAMVATIVTFNSCLSGINIPNEVQAAIYTEIVLFACFGLVQVYTLGCKESRREMPRVLDDMQYYARLKIHYAAVYDYLKNMKDVLPAYNNPVVQAQPKITSNPTDSQDTFNKEKQGLSAALTTFDASRAEVENDRIKQFDTAYNLYINNQKQRMLIAYRAEYAYITLSLFAKTILGGLLYISAIVNN
jgi:hypothetical protein